MRQGFLVFVSERTVNLPHASPSPILSPPPQHSTYLQPAIILGLTVPTAAAIRVAANYSFM
jgi:hypothetical protein